MTNIQIQCFLSAVETKNFTETAEALHFLPQTVSKNIRALEAELGTTLFRRINNRLELTESGLHYAQIFSQIRTSFQSAMDKAKDANTRRATQLRIAYSELLNPMGELLTVVNHFRQLHPGVHVSGVQSDTVLGIQRKRSDLAILLTRTPVMEGEFYSRYIVQAPEKLFVSPRLQLAPDAAIDPKCWGVPMIQSYAVKSSRLEYLNSVQRKLERVGLYPEKLELLPNMQSVSSTLHISPSVALSYGRFGFMSDMHHLKSFDLPNVPEPTWLCCVWSRSCENPLVEPFVELMYQELNQ